DAGSFSRRSHSNLKFGSCCESGVKEPVKRCWRTRNKTSASLPARVPIESNWPSSDWVFRSPYALTILFCSSEGSVPSALSRVVLGALVLILALGVGGSFEYTIANQAEHC